MIFFRSMWAIYKKEMRVYFVGPLAYAFLTVVSFLSGLFFYLGATSTLQANLQMMFSPLALALAFLLPLLTMQHFAEEKRNGSFELLMTAPIPIWSMIIGKWASSLTLCLGFLVLTLIFPALLYEYGNPDTGVLITSYIGMFLCCAAFVSVGLFASSLSSEPVSCGFIGSVILLCLWLSGRAAVFIENETLRQFFIELSFQSHLDSFYRGLIDSSDVLWFVLFAFGFLFLTWRTIESQRWR